MTKPTEKKTAGRPPAVIPLTELEKLAQLHPTHEEIAAFFHVSRETVESRMRDDADFLAAIEKGRTAGKLSLRRKQLEVAMNGDRSMLIFLGKNLLGQSDDPNFVLRIKAGVEQELTQMLELLRGALEPEEYARVYSILMDGMDGQ